MFVGQFRWAETNQLAEYTNWIEGEPNNQYGDQDCVHKSLRGSGWDDIQCDTDSYLDFSGIYALCMRKYDQ